MTTLLTDDRTVYRLPKLIALGGRPPAGRRRRLREGLVRVLEKDDFNDSAHPRHPKGDPRGGQFAPKGGAGGVALSGLPEGLRPLPPGAIGLADPPAIGAGQWFGNAREHMMGAGYLESGVNLVGDGFGMERHLPHWLGIRYKSQAEAVQAAEVALRSLPAHSDEVGYFVRDGVIEWATRGTPEQISIRHERAPEAYMESLQGATFTHNHPGGLTTLSAGDLGTAMQRGFTIRAVSGQSREVWEFTPFTARDDTPRNPDAWMKVGALVHRDARDTNRMVASAAEHALGFWPSDREMIFALSKAVTTSTAKAMATQLDRRNLGVYHQVEGAPAMTMQQFLPPDMWKAAREYMDQHGSEFFIGSPVPVTEASGVPELSLDDGPEWALLRDGPSGRRRRPGERRRRVREALVRVLEKDGFNDSDHPRHPKGDPRGGQFAPKNAAGGALSAKDLKQSIGAGAPALYSGPRGEWTAEDQADTVGERSERALAALNSPAGGHHADMITELQAADKEYELEGLLKDNAVIRLAARAGVPYDLANAVIAQWATASNDHDMRSLSIQQAISAEFGVAMSPWQQSRVDAIAETAGLYDGSTRPAFLRSLAGDLETLAKSCIQMKLDPGELHDLIHAGLHKGPGAEADRAALARLEEQASTDGPSVHVRAMVNAMADDSGRLLGSERHDLLARACGAMISTHAHLGFKGASALDVLDDAQVLRRLADDPVLGSLSPDYKGGDAAIAQVAAKLGNTRSYIARTPIADQATLRRVVRAMYNLTQEDLKASGFKGAVVYRGASVMIRRGGKWVDAHGHDPGGVPRSGLLRMISSQRGDMVRTRLSSAGSYSASRGTARGFGSMVTARRIRPEEVLSTPRTGNGCWDESEFVVLGTPDGYGYERIATRDKFEPITEAATPRERLQAAVADLAGGELDLSAGPNADWLQLAAPEAMKRSLAIHARLAAKAKGRRRVPRRQLREALRRLTEANPYHEPAGSRVGGRFARRPGGTVAAIQATLHSLADPGAGQVGLPGMEGPAGGQPGNRKGRKSASPQAPPATEAGLALTDHQRFWLKPHANDDPLATKLPKVNLTEDQRLALHAHERTAPGLFRSLNLKTGSLMAAVALTDAALRSMPLAFEPDSSEEWQRNPTARERCYLVTRSGEILGYVDGNARHVDMSPIEAERFTEPFLITHNHPSTSYLSPPDQAVMLGIRAMEPGGAIAAPDPAALPVFGIRAVTAKHTDTLSKTRDSVDGVDGWTVLRFHENETRDTWENTLKMDPGFYRGTPSAGTRKGLDLARDRHGHAYMDRAAKAGHLEEVGLRYHTTVPGDFKQWTYDIYEAVTGGKTP